MNLSEKQKEAFESIWFIYGNGGPKCTMLNHKLIQGFIEHNEDRRDSYLNADLTKSRLMGMKDGVTDECIKVCNLILDGEIDEAIKISKS